MKNATRRKIGRHMFSKVTPWFQNDFVTTEEDPTIRFDISRTFVQARMDAGLSQDELAKRMGTTRSVIERLESGQCLPNIDTIHRLAKATGAHFIIKLIN